MRKKFDLDIAEMPLSATKSQVRASYEPLYLLLHHNFFALNNDSLSVIVPHRTTRRRTFMAKPVMPRLHEAKCGDILISLFVRRSDLHVCHLKDYFHQTFFRTKRTTRHHEHARTPRLFLGWAPPAQPRRGRHTTPRAPTPPSPRRVCCIPAARTSPSP